VTIQVSCGASTQQERDCPAKSISPQGQAARPKGKRREGRTSRGKATSPALLAAKRSNRPEHLRYAQIPFDNPALFLYIYNQFQLSR
jgi:hypothetical protein